MSKSIKPEDQKKAREAVRKANNIAIVNGDLWRSTGGNQGLPPDKTPPPPVPGKAFSHAAWARVVESADRVGQVIRAMERDKDNKELDVLAARLDMLVHEATELVKNLGGHQ